MKISSMTINVAIVLSMCIVTIVFADVVVVPVRIYLMIKRID